MYWQLLDFMLAIQSLYIGVFIEIKDRFIIIPQATVQSFSCIRHRKQQRAMFESNCALSHFVDNHKGPYIKLEGGGGIVCQQFRWKNISVSDMDRNKYSESTLCLIYFFL